MKSLKGLIVLTLLSFVIAPVVLAQPTQFQEVIEVKVKPGYEETYENLIKMYMEASEKTSNPILWMTFRSDIGKSGPIYRIVLPFNKWGERDAWPDSVIKKGLGEEKAKQAAKMRAASVESVTTRIWEHLEDGSSNVPTETKIANFYQVTIREIAPNKVDEYRNLQRKFKAAYDKAGKPVVMRSVLVYGESQNSTFRRSEAFDKWAEGDEGGVEQILADMYGDEWNVMLDTLGEIVIRTENFVSAYRPDLSRVEAPATTN